MPISGCDRRKSMLTFSFSARARRGLLAGMSLAVALGGGVLAGAPSASAYSTVNWPISCSAVKIRANHSTSSTALGVGYRGDRDVISKVYYNTPANPQVENSWLYGTVTRKSDGRRVTGWVVSTCIDSRA
jgi:hypothetical protein